jgi:hypothetical protein
MRAPSNERGVAMTTVIFVGAALTALTSTAVFVTIQDFRSGTDDRKSAEALAYAEAGIDRFMEYLRSGVTYGVMVQAGCEKPALSLPPGSVGNGTFTVSMQVFDPTAADPVDRYPQPPAGGACAPGKRNLSSPRSGQFFLITSTGEHPASKRVIQQVIKVRARNLPIGLFANQFDGNGNPDLTGISIISPGQVIGRNKLAFQGLDPYYKLDDFWPGHAWTGGLTGASPAPAAAHALGGLFIGKDEFPPNPNCTANSGKAAYRQSLWDSDGSAGSGPITGPMTGPCLNQPPGYVGAFPPTSKFTQEDFDRVAGDRFTPEDHAALKRAAQDYGLYCFYPLSGASSCTRQGTPIAGTTTISDVSPILDSGTNNFVAYFEFEGGDPAANNIKWKTHVWGCNSDPALNRSVVIVVKEGGVDVDGNYQVNGAIVADGNFDYHGNPEINGSIMAGNFVVRGNAKFTMDSCWVSNLPGPFLQVTPTQWSEIDR